MKAEPLSKKLMDKAKSLGIKTIELSFSGGSDEGYLDIYFNDGDIHNDEFYHEVEKWAWDTYSYSGAGDGSDYGDKIIYDLENMKVTTSDWHMERTESADDEDTLEVDEKD